MRALDTNLIVRVLMDDPDEPEQTRIARLLVAAEKTVLVPDLALVELTWVLRSNYGFTRKAVAEAVGQLVKHSRFVLERPALAAAALALYIASAADFADCWMLAAMREKGAELLTFDKKFAKLDGVKLLF